MTPVVSGALDDFERKRARAVHHFTVIQQAVDAFVSAKRAPVPGAFDAKRSQYTFDAPLEPIDPDLSTVLGDFAYDTRAALDYLITALIRSAGNAEHTDSEFPIYGVGRRPGSSWLDVARRWQEDPGGSIAKKLRDTPSGTKTALEPLQPFYKVPLTNPLQHPLLWLQAMNNRDKHRRLNLLANGVAAKFVDDSGEPRFPGPIRQARVAHDPNRKGYTATLVVRQEYDRPIYLLPGYDVRLHEPPELIGELVETLTSINQFIDRRVLPVIQTLLPPP